MPDVRGRRSVGGFLGDYWQPSGPEDVAAAGQPVMHRMQGVPTMPGYRDRVPKWNFDLGFKLLRKIFLSLIGI